jgi:hypothetical protein
MIPTKNEVNYKIDWHSIDISSYIDPTKTNSKEAYEMKAKVLDDRKHYFSMLRKLFQDLKNLGNDKVDDILALYNIHFVDIDDIPRVNIDEPKL